MTERKRKEMEDQKRKMSGPQSRSNSTPPFLKQFISKVQAWLPVGISAAESMSEPPEESEVVLKVHSSLLWVLVI
jgi:hypothetical protein